MNVEQLDNLFDIYGYEAKENPAFDAFAVPVAAALRLPHQNRKQRTGECSGGQFTRPDGRNTKRSWPC